MSFGQIITWAFMHGEYSGLILVVKHALENKQKIGTNNGSTVYFFADSLVGKYINNDVYEALPDAIRNGVQLKNKSTSTTSIGTTGYACWAPRANEIQATEELSIYLHSALPLFSTTESRIRTLGKTGAAVEYYLGDNSTGAGPNWATISETGTYFKSGASGANELCGVVFGICLGHAPSS